MTNLENQSNTTCQGCCYCLGRTARRRRPTDEAKIADSNRKYTHLMAAARDCFNGNVPEVWARADRLVRVKFKQQERTQCDEVGAELAANQLLHGEVDFLVDMMDADREARERSPLSATLYQKLSQMQLEDAPADCEAPESDAPESEAEAAAQKVSEPPGEAAELDDDAGIEEAPV